MYDLSTTIPPNETVAEALNTLLADYAIYLQKVRSYHWNVRGKRFFQLHDVFEGVYTRTAGYVDDLAERVARLQGRPASTYAEFLKLARLTEDPSRRGADEMIRNLLEDLDALNTLSTRLAERAAEAHDLATSTMLEDIITRQEETAWMLSAWLNE